MRSSAILQCTLATAALGAVVPRNAVTTVTVTVPCESEAATAIASPSSSTYSFAPSSTPLATADVTYTGGSVTLGPVSNPSCDPSKLSNIVPKSNLTLHYGSDDTSTPDSNAQISVQMKLPSVMLEDIQSVHTVVCSNTGVVITFSDVAGYEKSIKEWPTSGDFVIFTNHLGNCDVEFERGIFLVRGVASDRNTLTVVATAEKSDFQSIAGSMQVDFGHLLGPIPSNSTTGPYSNTTTPSKRDIHWDPTYSLNFNKALPQDTTVASIDPYISVIANTASFTSTASFSGHLDYNFWRFKIDKLYFDLDVAFDATLDLTSSISSSTLSHTFSYAPASLALTPISIPGVLALGPALDFSIGAQLSADANVNVVTRTEVTLRDGNVHIDLLDGGNTGTTGWTPQSAASATLDVSASVQVDPYVLLGVEVAVNFLGGLVDLGAGVRANATLANRLAAQAGVEIGTGMGVTGTVGGACADGVEYRSDFIFGVEGFVTQFYSRELYGVDVPVFDKCWALGGL